MLLNRQLEHGEPYVSRSHLTLRERQVMQARVERFHLVGAMLRWIHVCVEEGQLWHGISNLGISSLEG